MVWGIPGLYSLVSTIRMPTLVLYGPKTSQGHLKSTEWQFGIDKHLASSILMLTLNSWSGIKHITDWLGQSL
jgi:hypothetical protein